MNKIMEKDLTFSFPPDCQASKYDDWPFYQKQFQAVAGGSKAVDILCVKSDTSWLIEIKDYRRHDPTEPPPQLSDIAEKVIRKVRDTLAGLAAAAKAAHETDQRKLAQKALKTSQWRVVLHLELPAELGELWPKEFNHANLLLKLRKKTLEAVDDKPIVCDRKTTPQYYIP